jgi:hypothetical protein
MLKRDKHTKRPSDLNQLAHRLVELSTEESNGGISLPTKAQVSLLMAQLGRKGGKIGGKRRLQTLTKEERSEITRKAARARWKAK